MQKPIIGTAIISILLILGIIFYWQPKYQEINNLRMEIKEKKIELENKEAYFSELSQFSLKLEKYSSELDKINSFLPTSPGIPDIFSFLQKESFQNGLTLDKIGLEKPSLLKKESRIFKIPLSLTLSGHYSAFKNFLSSIQKSARLIEIESISFSAPDKEETFSFNLKIKIYSY